MSIKRRSVLPALVLLATAAPHPYAANFSVTGSGYVSLDNAVTRTPWDIVFSSTSGSQSVTGQGSLDAFNTNDGILSAAGGEGSAFAAPGELKAKVRGYASVGSAGPNIPTITHGAPRTQASFSALFSDELTLQSATLPIGTPVSYRATIHMERVTNNPGWIGPQWSPDRYASGNFFFSFQVGPSIGSLVAIPNSLFQSVPSHAFELPYTANGAVGDVISVGAQLGVSADDRAGYYLDSQGMLRSWQGPQETVIDASNTAKIYFDVLTPDVLAVAASGHDYAFAAAVPEPATWATMTAGLLFMAVILRRRRGRS
jgi:hypothetical protein